MTERPAVERAAVERPAVQRPAFQRPPTAQEAVLAELRIMISTGELRPGEPIRQVPVARALGVSRVPVREALKVLQAEGQAAYSPHRGYVVRTLDLTELRECYRIRELLEAEAVRAGIPHLSIVDIDLLATTLSEVESAGTSGDLLALAAANRRFHFGLYEASGMPRLVSLIRILWDTTDPYRSRYFTDPANRAAINAEHRAVLAAIRAGEADRAVALLDAHRTHALDTLTAELDPLDSPGGAR
jgi:DNA-binding GntR family transcriptional regulator